MPIPVTITLTSISGATSPGPFSIYSCIESTCSGSLTPFVTGVTLSDLQTGSFVPDISGNTPTYVKIKSTGGVCTYEIIKPIIGIPTSTPTPTVTATPEPTPTPTPTPLGSTNTPTPTPTPTSSYFSGNVRINIAYEDACSIGSYLPATGNQLTFCESTTFTSSNFYPLGSGNYYLSDGNGYIQVNHVNGTNTVEKTSGGGCTYCPGAPTHTPTPTPTATPTPYYQVDILLGVPGQCSNTASACYAFNVLNTTPNHTIFTTTGNLVDGGTAYMDGLGPDGEIFVGGPGPGYYYTDGYSYARISSLGVITVVDICACS